MTKMKQLRIERGLTIKEVADAVGTDQGNLSRIENGRQVPGRQLATRLYDFYRGEVSMIEILMPEHDQSAA